MKKIVLKKPVIYLSCFIAFVLSFGILYYVDYSNSKLDKKPEEDFQYVSRLFGSDDLPVVASEAMIMRPYTDDNVKILQNFYDYKGSEEQQENSITNYEQTYIQNSGVVYGGIDNGFDVTASLAGTVTSIKDDNLLGKVVEIKVSDKVITTYQSLSEVMVKEGAEINQGDVIGKSGESNINKDLGSHMVFKLKIDGNYVNAEEYYDKNINEL